MSENSKELMVKVLKEHHGTKTNTEIAKVLKTEYFKEFGNKSTDSLRKRVSELRVDLGLSTQPIQSPITSDEKIKVVGSDLEINSSDWTKTQLDMSRLKDKVKQAEKISNTYKSELSWANSKLDVAFEMEQHTKTKWNIEKSKKNVHSEAVAFIVASDWHYEERVDPETIQHLNEYSPPIADKRAMNFFKNAKKLFDIESKDVQINQIVMPILGDMISGNIHPELVEDNYMSPIEAILKVGDLISSGIDFLLKETKCLLTIPCKHGNHARTTPDKRYATSWKNSYEYLMYCELAKYYSKNDRVQFIVEKGNLTYLPVFDYTIRMHHGDSFGYNSGIGGVAIPILRGIAALNKQYAVADLDIFGHFHTQMLDTGSQKFVLNGSLIGFNAYAQDKVKAPYEKPKQSFFLLDRDRGMTISAPIFVE